jgi:hypothetical protein
VIGRSLETVIGLSKGGQEDFAPPITQAISKCDRKMGDINTCESGGAEVRPFAYLSINASIAARVSADGVPSIAPL